MRENRNVPFRDWNIRVSRNHNGQLHICAVDICDILKRDELLENGAIARVCPTALKISFRKNGREQWGFRPIDMRRLLQLVRKETIIPRDLLDELEVWGNKLLELEAGELHAVPQDDIVMHFEEGFPVTFRSTPRRSRCTSGKSRLNGYASLPRICSAGKWPATDIPGNTSRKSSPHGGGGTVRPGWNHRLSYRWPDGSPLTCLWRNGWARLSANSP